MKNLNGANTEAATKADQDKIEAHLKQKHPNATVRDVLGAIDQKLST